MRYLKRITLSITRLKVRTLGLFITIFVFASAISIVTAIHQSTIDASDRILNEIPLITSVRLDYDKYNEGSFGDIEMMTLELIEEIGSVEQVDYYDYNITQQFQVGGIKSYTELDIPDLYTYLNFRGVAYPDVLDFKQGVANLISGRTFTQEELDMSKPVGIISKDLAELNNLSEGDNFSITDVTYEYIDGEWTPTTQYENIIEIIGIYEYEGYDDYGITAKNTVYVSNAFIVSVFSDIDPTPEETFRRLIDIAQPNYVLKSPNDIESFVQEVTEKLPSYYSVDSTINLYHRLAQPLSQLEKTSFTSLITLLISGAIVLILLVFVYTRSKRYELGVYKSMGESNNKLIRLLLGELLVVSLVSLTLALFSGYTISKTIVESSTRDTLRAQDIDENTWKDPVGDDYLNIEIDVTELATSYEIVLSPAYITRYYGYTMGLLTVAALISIVYMVRLQPQKLLM